jgi:hypothetical protein
VRFSRSADIPGAQRDRNTQKGRIDTEGSKGVTQINIYFIHLIQHMAVELPEWGTLVLDDNLLYFLEGSTGDSQCRAMGLRVRE